MMIYIFHAKTAKTAEFFILYHAGAGEVASYATTGERRGWTIHPPPPLRSSHLSQGDSQLQQLMLSSALPPHRVGLVFHSEGTDGGGVFESFFVVKAFYLC